MITITTVGNNALVQRLQRIGPTVHAKLLRAVTKIVFTLEAYIKTQKLSGQVLKVRTGALKSSIQSRVEDKGALAVYGYVYSAGNVKYAAIHEFGGQTPPRVIVPRKAAVLAFMVGGKQVFARSVNHPGSKMPERSFLRSALKDKRVWIANELHEAVRVGVQAAADGGGG